MLRGPDEVQLALLEAGDPIEGAWSERTMHLPPPGPIVIFHVLGVPVPKGSKSANAYGHGVRDTNAAFLRPWEATVAAAADAQRCTVGTLDGPLGTDLTFRFPGSTGAPAYRKALGAVPMSVMPDLDKLVRAVWDGMANGGLIANDARIATLTAAKFHVWNDWVGVRIALRELPTVRRRA